MKWTQKDPVPKHLEKLLTDLRYWSELASLSMDEERFLNSAEIHICTRIRISSGAYKAAGVFLTF